MNAREIGTYYVSCTSIMNPFVQFPSLLKKKIRFVLTDIDDTLTVNGRLPSIVFKAMENLQQAGIRVIPITGRPAGWCDHMARMWPVDGLVGENGAFYFFYDPVQRKMIRRYWKSENQRKEDRRKLEQLKSKILISVPDCRISADQSYREADLAIDFCEDVPPLPLESIEKIVNIFHNAGARAKVSSIHVNGWFGNYDKLSMTHVLFKEIFNLDLKLAADTVLFIGDSPNDCPLFSFFSHSVGVSNILNFKDSLASKPFWITEKSGGYGFAEMTQILLS
jgi:HAD superfamily hydrolase (TIGR01484 family)